MDVKAIADEMAALFNAGKSHEIGEKYWADDVVSIEAGGPEGMDPVSRGRAAVEQKGQWWSSNHEVHNATAEGPFINGDQVAFRCEMDVKVKSSGDTMHMKEICLYTIKDGKIVEEKFLYGASPAA